jgi:hypothetical protein
MYKRIIVLLYQCITRVLYLNSCPLLAAHLKVLEDPVAKISHSRLGNTDQASSYPVETNKALAHASRARFGRQTGGRAYTNFHCRDFVWCANEDNLTRQSVVGVLKVSAVDEMKSGK